MAQPAESDPRQVAIDQHQRAAQRKAGLLGYARYKVGGV
jgi:hypothetical protein